MECKADSLASKAICCTAIAIGLLLCLDVHVEALDNGLAITPPMVGT